MAQLRLLIGTTSTIQLNGLADQDGNVINSATVTATLLDGRLRQVGGVSWPITLASTGSAGNYQGQLAALANLKKSHRYTLDVQVTSSGLNATFREPVIAEYGP